MHPKVEPPSEERTREDPARRPDAARNDPRPGVIREDEVRADALVAWISSPMGRRFLEAAEDLVLLHLFHWSRTGRTVLEVNCGTGLLQQALRRMGLDVTGCEPSPALRRIFVETPGHRGIIDPAHADLLPYGDGSFDHVLVHLWRGTDPEEAGKALAEARRVAADGVAVLVWNRVSLPGLFCRSGTTPLVRLDAWRLYHRLVLAGEGRVAVAGALYGPPATWGKPRPKVEDGEHRGHLAGPVRRLCRKARVLLAGCPLPGLFGGLCLLRLDPPPARPMTATPIRFRKVRFANGRLAQGCSERAGEQDA